MLPVSSRHRSHKEPGCFVPPHPGLRYSQGSSDCTASLQGPPYPHPHHSDGPDSRTDLRPRPGSPNQPCPVDMMRSGRARKGHGTVAAQREASLGLLLLLSEKKPPHLSSGIKGCQDNPRLGLLRPPVPPRERACLEPEDSRAWQGDWVPMTSLKPVFSHS